jgi:hypothetical protein
MIKRMIAGLAALTLVVAGCGSGSKDSGGDKNKASAPGITAPR